MAQSVLGLNGIFGVHKPAGPTSSKVVQQIKFKLLNTLSNKYDINISCVFLFKRKDVGAKEA